MRLPLAMGCNPTVDDGHDCLISDSLMAALEGALEGHVFTFHIAFCLRIVKVKSEDDPAVLSPRCVENLVQRVRQLIRSVSTCG